MSFAPDGLQAVLSRIATVSSAPTSVSEIRDRFGISLASAVTATQPTPATGVIQTAAAGVKNTVVMSTAPATRADPAAPDPAASAPVAPAGRWTDRLPVAGVPWAAQIETTAQQYGLEPEFLGAVIWTESNFQPAVVSPDGAIGMGQLMPATAEWLGVDPWNPTQNIDGAARYYRNLVDRFGSLELATAAYFAGPTAVSKAGGVPTERAANYVSKVLGRRDLLAGT